MPIRYFVSDVDRSVAWYTDLLGFAVVDRWGPAFAIVERQSVELWLSGPGTSAMKPMPDGRVPEPGGWNRIVVEVGDIASDVAKLHEAGASFRSELISGPGGRQCLVEDPDGNPIELFQPG